MDMCMDSFIGHVFRRVDNCSLWTVGPDVDICIDLCIDKCVAMCIDMCADMHIDMCVDTCESDARSSDPDAGDRGGPFDRPTQMQGIAVGRS